MDDFDHDEVDVSVSHLNLPVSSQECTVMVIGLPAQTAIALRSETLCTAVLTIRFGETSDSSMAPILCNVHERQGHEHLVMPLALFTLTLILSWVAEGGFVGCHDIIPLADGIYAYVFLCSIYFSVLTLIQ